MSWIAITVDTLNEAKIAKLISAADSKALAVGQAGRATGIIQGVVDDIRRKVASNTINRVDADLTTIPKGLRDLAVDLIIARLKVAIEMDLSEDERRQVSRRNQELDRIADAKDVIDQPDNPIDSPVQKGAAVEVASSIPRKATQEKMGGLI